jgi:hypothetical protein
MIANNQNNININNLNPIPNPTPNINLKNNYAFNPKPQQGAGGANNHKMKEVDDINMHIFNLKDDNLIDVDFDDRMNVDDNLVTRKEIFNLAEKQEGDDWEYLKKTITKDGKYLSDDFVKYHQITDQLIEDEDDIINGHMEIIKVLFVIIC